MREKCMKRKWLVLATLALGVAMAHRRASASSQVAYDYVTDQTTYSGTPGSVLTVKVFLRETLNGNPSIIDTTPETGLDGAAFEVVSTGTRPTNPSLMTAVSPDSADFADPSYIANVNNSHVSNPNEVDLQESTANGATTGVKTGNQGVPSNEVFLGTISVTVGSTAGTTSFNLGEYSVQGFIGGYTITKPDGYDADVSGTAHGQPYTGVGSTVNTFNVVSLPEPASASLFLLLGLPLLARRRSVSTTAM